MKSKKLFAILTLVAFMMTLVPAFAFGAGYNQGYSSVHVEDTSLDAGDSTTVTVQFCDKDNKRLSANTPVDAFWVESSRPTVKITVDKKYVADADAATGSDLIEVYEGGEIVAYELDLSSGVAEIKEGALKVLGNRGEIEFEVTSAAACVVELGFWNADPDEDTTKDFNRIGDGVVKIEFESKEGKINEVNLIPDDNTVTAGDEITLTAEVLDKNNDGISGKTVTFYKSDEPNSGWSKIGTATTNRKGEAEFEYTETEAGDFYYYAKCGNKDSRDSEKKGKKITVKPEEPSVIEFVTDEGKCFDVDADDDNNKIKFVVKDVYGNKITSPSDCEVKVTSAPDDSDLEDEIFKGSAIAWDNEDEELYIVVDFDKVGEYTFKAKVSGASAILTVKAVEVGDPVEIDVRFDEKKSLIAKDADNRDTQADALKLEVVVIDENGVETDADDYKVYSSNVSLAKVKEVDTGEVTLLGPSDKDDRGVVTITVVDRGSGLTDSIEVPVVGEPYAIDVDYTVSGKTATVTLQYVDDEGEVTASGDDDNYEIIAPEGITIREKEKFDEDSGEASFKAIANEYGEYKLTVVTDEGIAKKFEIVIGEPKDEQKGGKGLVTMFIGSTGYVVNGVPLISDVAPFIKDGRTFVAVRPLANAFGVAPENIGWDEVTGTVTLTRDDITVTIVIGSNDIEVVQDGVISTVTADVPAFIENGRTVLPFRAVGEAFGATVSWDEATQSVTYEL